jgi:hypothetical protein
MLFLLPSLVSCLWQVAKAQVPQDEVAALFALYISTSGEFWQWQNEQFQGPRWNFTQDVNGLFQDNPCISIPSAETWQGVTCSMVSSMCSNQTCHITGITLVEFGLNGSIPSEMGHLTALHLLDLANNQLTGPIPFEVGQLTALERLQLAKNQLTGSIPREIG